MSPDALFHLAVGLPASPTPNREPRRPTSPMPSRGSGPAVKFNLSFRRDLRFGESGAHAEIHFRTALRFRADFHPAPARLNFTRAPGDPHRSYRSRGARREAKFNRAPRTPAQPKLVPRIRRMRNSPLHRLQLLLSGLIFTWLRARWGPRSDQRVAGSAGSRDVTWCQGTLVITGSLIN